MKKVFIVTGELSGDLLGAWYVQKVYGDKSAYVEAIGGDHLAGAGAVLYRRFEELNVVGIAEILRHIPRLLSLVRHLVRYIIEQKFDEVVVIDFPGFNLRLIKKLKKVFPSLVITYFSPPQLWCWGAWRLATLKRCADRIVVLYPFEVAWYAQRGVVAEWIGSPVYDRMAPIFKASETKQNVIALLPGSRTSEVVTMLPLFIDVALALKKKYPELYFIVPKAASIPCHLFQKLFDAAEVACSGKESIFEIVDDSNKERLAHCCMALSKPGTVTLELALLKIPSIVVFKTSWLTYVLARRIVHVSFMGLPNLFLNEIVFPEFIQTFSLEQIVQTASMLYESILKKDISFFKKIEQLDVLASQLKPPLQQEV